MPLRLPPLAALVLAAFLCLFGTSPAQPRRGAIAARSLPRQQMARRYGPSLLTRLQSRTRITHLSASTFPNIPRANFSVPGRNPASGASSSRIALGTYYWQNGQCAPGDADAVSQWRTRTGRLPAVWMIFQSWTGWNHFPIAQARRARSLKGQLLVTWEPWSGNGNPGDGNWSCRRVAMGAYDGYIRSYAREVRASGVPVMLRFAHEMNGDWYPWGTAYRSGRARNNGNQPQDFVAMWRHVVALFRTEGATNARWVWSPNITYQNAYNTAATQQSDLWQMYPGDAWVDWIGLSVYNDGAKRSWRSFSNLFDDSYDAITRLTSKPLMIAEIGVTEQGAPLGDSKAQWIQQAFLADIPNRYPRVKLVNYFCRDKTEFGEANYRFDSSPAALRAFRMVASSPLYQGHLAF